MICQLLILTNIFIDLRELHKFHWLGDQNPVVNNDVALSIKGLKEESGQV